MRRNGWIDGSSLAMGLPLGVAVGLVLDHPAFGIPIGIVFAIAFSASRTRKPTGEEGAAEDRGSS